MLGTDNITLKEGKLIVGGNSLVSLAKRRAFLALLTKNAALSCSELGELEQLKELLRHF